MSKTPADLELRNFVTVLEKDARECVANLLLLKNMERVAKEQGIKRSDKKRVLFPRIWGNAQTCLMTSLSRLLDDGSDAVSVVKMRRDQRFKHPSKAKEIRKNFNRETHKKLKSWRTNLLAHSLLEQMERDIPSTDQLTINELGEEVSVCLQLIHAYALENNIRIRRLPKSYCHSKTQTWMEVDYMARGIMSLPSGFL